MMSINKKQERFITDRLPLKIHDVLGVPAQKHSETTHKRRRPFFIAHFFAAGIEPHDVLYLGTADPPAPEKFRPPENRMVASEANQVFGEFEQLILFFIALPIEPADLVVLTVGVVISLWVRPNSSPPQSIGTPWERNSVVRRFRRCCPRKS